MARHTYASWNVPFDFSVRGKSSEPRFLLLLYTQLKTLFEVNKKSSAVHEMLQSMA